MKNLNQFMLDHVTHCPVNMFEVGILTAPQKLAEEIPSHRFYARGGICSDKIFHTK